MLIDVAMDSDLMRQYFDGPAMHTMTPSGLRIIDYSVEKRRHVNFPNSITGDAHPDATLACLATSGIPTDAHFRVDGQEVPLSEALRYRITRFRLEAELPWTLISLSLYLPPRRSWTNRFNETFTFDMVARHLVDEPSSSVACFGTHNLNALCVLLNADTQEQVLTGETRQTVLRHLQEKMQLLEARQDVDGSWTVVALDLPSHVDSPDLLVGDYDLEARILITGHTLEWLGLLPVECEANDETVLHAARFLVDSCVAHDAHDVQNAFSSWSHASHALQLWFPDEWREYIELRCASGKAQPITEESSAE